VEEASQAIDLGRERSVGEILSATLAIYWRYPFLFAVLALAVVAPYELARLAVTGYGPLASGGGRDAGASGLFDLLDLSLVGPLISALHIHAVVEIGDGRRPRLGSVAMKGLRVLPIVVAAEIVANILIGIGFLAFVVPGLLLAVRWSVVAQTAAVDHEGWLPALRRSGRLAAGNYGHIFGLLVVVWVATIAIGVAAGMSFRLTGSGPFFISHGTSVGWVLVGIAVHTVIASFMALTLAILYFDLRAGEAQQAGRSMSEYQHLPDLD
jgi:hypothetical protein